MVNGERNAALNQCLRDPDFLQQFAEQRDHIRRLLVRQRHLDGFRILDAVMALGVAMADQLWESEEVHSTAQATADQRKGEMRLQCVVNHCRRVRACRVAIRWERADIYRRAIHSDSAVSSSDNPQLTHKSSNAQTSK